MSRKKNRKYHDSYLDYGFTYINTAGEEKPQCVICYKVLSNFSMKPSKLKLHFQTHHSSYSQKDRTFFERHRSSLKKMKLDSDGSLHETNSKIIKAVSDKELNLATVIYPATQRHIDKYRKQDVEVLEETAEDYRNITLPYLEGLNRFSIQWVFNILDKKTESERIVIEDPDPERGFILLPDMKWDTKDVESLYLIAIVHKRGIKSLRDLTTQHLPLLRNILEKGQDAIFSKYGVPKEKLRIYVHYQPSYYHLHVHFTHIDFDAPGITVTRAHLLKDVIENIELLGDYYQRKSMTFVGRKDDQLTLALKKTRETT